MILVGPSSLWQTGMPAAYLLGPQGLEAVLVETEKEWKAMGETQVQVTTTSQTQSASEPANVPSLCLLPLGKDHPGDLLHVPNSPLHP